MALDMFRLMRGIEIEKDDLSLRSQILVGSGAPGNDSGEQDAAPIGSVYMRTDAASGENFYWKWQSLNSVADWKIAVGKDYVDSLAGGSSWREPVRVIDSSLYANPSAFPTGGVVDGVTLIDGDRVLFSNVTTGNDNIYIWDAGSSTWTEDPLNPNSDGDAVFAKEGTSADSLFFYDGANWVKYADALSYAELAFLRSFVGKSAAGNIMPNYTSNNIVIDSTSLMAAVSALDVEAGYVNSFIGKTAGNVTPNYTSNNIVVDTTTLVAGVSALDAAIGDRQYTQFTANILTDSETVTASLEALNVAVGDRTYTSQFNVTSGQAVAASIDALDIAIGSRTYTNQYVVTNSQSVTASIDALDMAMGSGDITNISGGYAITSNTTWGTVAGTNDVTDVFNELNNAIGDRNFTPFTANILTDGQTVTASLEALNSAIGDRTYTNDRVVVDGQTVAASIDALDTAVGDLQDLTKESTGTNVTASNTVVDSIPVSMATEVLWMVQAKETAASGKRRALQVHALTDGTNVDSTEYAVLKLGGGVTGFDVSVVISGGNIELTMTAGVNVDYVVKRISYSAF